MVSEDMDLSGVGGYGFEGVEGREDQGVVGIKETMIGTHYMEKIYF